MVCGTAAAQWWKAEADPRSALLQLHAQGAQALYLANDGKELMALADHFPGAVWRSPLPESQVLRQLRDAAFDALPAQVLHATLVRIASLGVLLRGASGTGKTALALALIERGHALIADDAVAVRRLGPALLVGACPAPLAGAMAVAGLGVVDVAGVYGAAAVTRRCRLDLAIDLPSLGTVATPDTPDQRLRGRWHEEQLLGERLWAVTAPPRHGGVLATWALAACAAWSQRMAGHDAAADLDARQRELLKTNEERTGDQCSW